jgi:6-phosphogluconolactonase
MTRYVYIGTYTYITRTEHRPEGIYLLTINPETGHLTPAGGFVSGPNPSFLAVHPNKRFVYSVNEGRDGAASSFALDPSTGALTRLNSQPTGGADPCYISFDPSGKYVLIANYSGGSLCVLPILADGTLGPQTDHVQHVGKGPNEQRQEKAHAHSIRFDPSGKFALACDLGMDQVFIYHLENGKLILHNITSTPPGAGPRHLEFNKAGNVLYIANELNSTVTVCDWDSPAGKATPRESLSTLPEGFEGESTVADIHLHLSGRVLYVSNRGDDSLARFMVDLATGSLTPAGHTKTHGATPRNFAIDPEGRYLIAANQDGNSLVVFAAKGDGLLTPTGQVLEYGRPVCVQMVDI